MLLWGPTFHSHLKTNKVLAKKSSDGEDDSLEGAVRSGGEQRGAGGESHTPLTLRAEDIWSSIRSPGRFRGASFGVCGKPTSIVVFSYGQVR